MYWLALIKGQEIGDMNIFLHAFYTLMILHFTFPHYYISCNKQRNKFKKEMEEEIKMKNRMKKLLVLATAATMMTAAFTGCGSMPRLSTVPATMARP